MESRTVVLRPERASILGILLLLLGWAAGSHAQKKDFSVVVLWEPNKEEDLAGYRVYYGTASRNYSQVIDVGRQTNCLVRGLEGKTRYYFAVTAYDYSGNESDFSKEVSVIPEDLDSFMPAVFVLYQNYPNPFNPRTTIPFYLPERSHIFLEIVDPQGRNVRLLQKGWFEAGRHTAEWDGTNNRGWPVASGVYFVRLRSGAFQLSHPVVLER